MFGHSVRLFKLFGFEVKIDLSWLILAVLITWTLAKGWFPYTYKNFSTETYWLMGVAGAIGLFLSIVFHELSHSLVARQYGIPMRGITLFIFGGVAEMNDEPPSAKSEFMMAIAGPIASIVIGAIFYVINSAINVTVSSQPTYAVIDYLAYINLILAGFNLVPAFPLDGGRVLRSGLWWWKKNLRWATRISSQIGAAFGIFLIVIGAVSFFAGNFVGGVWWFLIGMFLHRASRMSYQQLLVRKAIEGENIERFMKTDPVTVSPSMTLEDLVEDYIYKHHYKMFPVVDHEKLVGCVRVDQVKEIPKDQRKAQTVSDIADKCSEDNTVSPKTDAVKVLSKMRQSGNSRLMVVENSHLVGIVSLKDMLSFLSFKIDLEDGEWKA